MSASDIRILAPDVAARIAAGEVVERPASALKELVENAVDAGARRVDVRLEEGGIRSLTVTDDGEGMTAEALPLALQRHATSKIRRAEDLFALSTYGFRGEALAALAAAATRLELASRPGEEAVGMCLTVEDGQATSPTPCAMAPGTRVEIRDLFGRLPARRAFLRSPRAETAACHDITVRLALAVPNLSLRLATERGELLFSPGSGDRADVLAMAYGESVRRGLRAVTARRGGVEVEGYLADPVAARPTRAGGTLIVQGRVVESRALAHAVETAYQGRIMRGRFPVYVLAVRLDPALVDVNVHPQKREVRFSDERAVYGAVLEACRAAWEGRTFPVGWGALPGRAPFSHTEPSAQGQVAEDRADSASPHAQEPDLGNSEGPAEMVAADVAEAAPVPAWAEDAPGSWLTGVPTRRAGADRTADAAERVGRQETPEERLAVPAWRQVIVTHARGPEGSPEIAHRPTRGDNADVARMPRRLIALRQIRLLYILAEDVDGLVLVDQHAASERVHYERLLATLRSGQGAARQRLIEPMVLTVAPGLDEVCEIHREELLRWGFEVRPFGTGAVRVSAVPAGMRPGSRSLGDLLLTFADHVADPLHERAALVACHTAVRAGDPLSPSDMQSLLDAWGASEAPATCPHGRPCAHTLPWDEVARWFARRA